jgi:hypothetical protein
MNNSKKQTKKLKLNFLHKHTVEILFLSLVSNVACRVVVCGAMVNPTECHIQLSAILFDFLAQYYFCFVVVTFLILKTKKRVGVRCCRDGIHATTGGSPPSYRTPDLRNERKSSPPFNKLHSMRRSFLPPVGATLQSKKHKSRNSAAEPAEGFINNNKKCASSPSARCEYVRLGTWLWKPRLALLQLWVW